MKKNGDILNDLKTLKKLQDITNQEDTTIMIEKNDNVSPSNCDEKNQLPMSLRFKLFFRKTYDSLFPPKCYVCNKGKIDSEKSLVCDDCKKIYNDYEINKVFYNKEGKEIGLGIYRYDGIVRYLIQKMKFGKNKKIGIALAELSEDKLRKFLYRHHVNYIVPIPIHKDRLKERGFNQSEVIASVLSEKLGVPMRTDLIGRSKYTIPQSKLKNSERMENIKGSFEILNEFEIMGKDIILVDDIYTTGSTIEECSRVLTEHNTRKVYFLSISISNNKLKGECKNEN